jgi:hypothetical protein
VIPYPADDAANDPFHDPDSFIDHCDWLGVCPGCGDPVEDCVCDTLHDLCDTDTAEIP